MSTISNRHSVIPFVAGKSTALTNQRLAKVGYKSTKDKKTGKEKKARFASVCVSVPTITDDQIIPLSDRLIPFVRSMIADAQDGIIRSLYESATGKLMSVGDEEISVESCINYLISEQSGDRLNSQMLEEWFDSSIKDAFTVLLCEQNKIEDVEDPKIVQTVNGYRGVVASINGRNSLSQAQRTEVRNLLKACDVLDDRIAVKVLAKLNEQEKVVESFCASLGFSVG